jgi:hypothetical protein
MKSPRMTGPDLVRRMVNMMWKRKISRRTVARRRMCGRMTRRRRQRVSRKKRMLIASD